ncbi:MAG: amidohydrolase [Gemmatimonadetes bacterium]|nr:amidohydrolase [Gemmatimonadota bacterium]
MKAEEPKDILFLGGRVHLLGGRPPAEALLVRAGRVLVTGSEADVRSTAAPDATVIDLEGGTITPGLTDAHVHLTAWALGRRRVDLSGVASLDAAVEKVARFVPSGNGWLLGRGWNRHLWGELPTRRPLDQISPHAPVLLESQDIHSAWLNSEALRRCSIDRHTPDPPGGHIVRDADGDPTGLLLESARVLALRHVPRPDEAEVLDSLLEAQAEAHRLGITAVHSVEPTGLADFERLRARDQLRLRVLQHIMLEQLDAAMTVGLRSGFGGDWLKIGGVKMFLDGALGSCTALMREPYESGGGLGIQTLSSADFREAARRAAAAGLASTVHAIGDAAVELALRVLGDEVAPPATLPHRIEHLQLCPPDLWELACRSGVVASMQSTHLLTDIPAAELHWGTERSRGAYAFAPLLRGGMTLALGSDVPVETLDPRPGLFAATCRETWTGPWQGGEWFPEHSLTNAEAISAYTEGPADAAREGHRRGRLLPGYDADLAVWNRDPLTATPQELREMNCTMTVVAGEVVHRA